MQHAPCNQVIAVISNNITHPREINNVAVMLALPLLYAGVPAPAAVTLTVVEIPSID